MQRAAAKRLHLHDGRVHLRRFVRAAHGAAVRRHLSEVIANSGPLQEALPTLAEANLQLPLAHVCALLDNRVRTLATDRES